jgi:glucose uptake protein GlcU
MKNLASKKPLFTSVVALVITSANLTRVKNIRNVDAIFLIAFGMALGAVIVSLVSMIIIKRRQKNSSTDQ